MLTVGAGGHIFTPNCRMADYLLSSSASDVQDVPSSRLRLLFNVVTS